MTDVQTGMRDVFTFIAYWIFVPLIFGGIFLLGRSIMQNASAGEQRTSARAGFWAGLLLFAIYFIYNIKSFTTPQFLRIATLQIDIQGVVIGAVAGFILLFILKFLIPTRVVGFVVLALVFSSTSALYSYVFIQTFNKWLLSSTIGVAFGALVHMTAWPKSTYAIFGKKEDKEEE